VDVKNTGDVEAYEVVQLYTSPPRGPTDLPPHSLRGFDRILLQPGQTKTIAFKLSVNDFSVVTEKGERVVLRGTHHVYVSGHQPSDEKGLDASNVVEAKLEL